MPNAESWQRPLEVLGLSHQKGTVMVYDLNRCKRVCHASTDETFVLQKKMARAFFSICEHFCSRGSSDLEKNAMGISETSSMQCNALTCKTEKEYMQD